ncbi:MAG: tRNA threonylcarbamoyladenosine dehydratase [Bacteroidota bacterium]
MEHALFHRSELLLGKERMQKLASAKVIIFGIGGVGSWCAESLVRSGISNITIVDSDRICVTNINRQVHATTSSVGLVKTDVLKARLLDINPNANIVALQKIYNKDTYQEFDLESYDYIIDAIDSLGSKVHLIKTATEIKTAVFYSSMGASLKVDSTQIQVGDFWSVKMCPLARKLRKMLRKISAPKNHFQVVFSEELLENNGASESACGSAQCMCPKSKEGPGNPELADHEWCSLKAQINGSLAHITAMFGFTIAGMVVKDIYYKID